ncbi:hypothetical protein ABT084_13730 [Streptomyces sp. NPDC002138]|uniref:hypothetical protein n=1 Tax=Streptomyces sp. NPDC002138 TaxID=3154410 RepID=UPI003333E521
MASIETRTISQAVARLFMPEWPEAPADCAKCQKWAEERSKAKGPLAGTVVSDRNVLIRRHAARGHA